jgi:hypothetical protein
MLDGYIYNSNLFKNDFQYKFEDTGRKIEYDNDFFIFKSKLKRSVSADVLEKLYQ